MDDDDYPFDMDAAIDEEENMMHEEMYADEAGYMEPDDAEQEMAAAALGPAVPEVGWGGGSKALYSPPNPKYEYKPSVSTPIDEDFGDNFDSTRPVGNTNTGSLFTFATPLATRTAPFQKIASDQFLHERPEAGDAQLTAVLQDWSRHFLRSRKGKSEAELSKRPASGHLLSLSMEQLSLEADKLQRRLLTSKNRRVDDNSHTPLLANESSLWVDKYSPKQFSQLLSSEKTNREVLKALKQWDTFVFGPKGQKKAKGDTRPFLKVLLLCGPPGTGKTTIAHVAAEHCGYRPMEMNASDDRSVDALRETIGRAVTSSTLDKDKRPNCLILDEIDGIDGRGPIEALIDIIKAPLRAEKKGGKQAGDGAKNGTFPLTRPLICICNDLFSPQLRELRKHAQVFVFSSPMEMRLVQRLRNVCLSEGIQVQSGVLSLLSAATGFDIRSSINTLQFASLKSQADKANGASGAAGEVGAVLMSMLSSGLKDVDKDLFQVWKEIFWLKEAARAFSKKKRNDPQLKDSPPPRPSTDQTASSGVRVSAGGGGTRGSAKTIDVASLRRIRESEFGAHSGTTKPSGDPGASRVAIGFASDVVDSVIGFGDNQLIVDGLFENYLGVRYQDPAMSRTSASVDWLCDADLWQGKYGGDALSDGHQTSKYVPLVAGAVHLLCSAGTRPDLAWPRKESNMRFSRQHRESIVHAVIEGAPQHNLSLRQKLIVAIEVIPYLFDIISPPIRPAAMQTLSKPEQELLKGAAAVMASCGIRYEYKSNVLSSLLASNFGDDSAEVEGNDSNDQAAGPDSETGAENKFNALNGGNGSRGDEGSLFHLTPAINELCEYDSVAELSGRRRIISPEVKNMFYLETQKAMISARHDAQANMEVVEEEVAEPVPVAVEQGSDAGAAAAVPSLPAQSSRGQGMFFSKSNINRKRALEGNGDSSAAAINAAKKQQIRFRFSQGFSAAVKRPVKISEFL